MQTPPTLFPTDVPRREWARFDAAGFDQPVSGMIFPTTQPEGVTAVAEKGVPVNGVPLGSIGTGCIDLEANGTLGLCTVFNSHVPRRLINKPFLGLSVGGRPLVLAKAGRAQDWICYWDGESQKLGSLPRDPFRDILYWGHYPVADLEYVLADWPVSVGLRAWAPFIPGDVDMSSIPGAVFEVHIRNTTDTEQAGTVAFSFPGPSEDESWGSTSFARERIEGVLSGVHVANERDVGYVLGVIGGNARVGGELGTSGEAWAHIEDGLPEPSAHRPGASVAAEFRLNPRESTVLRFVLSWHSPRWKGGGTPTAGGHTYTHMYSTKYHNAVEAAETLALKHESLLRRVLSWQQAVYADEALPHWLQDSLMNLLSTITENSLWAVAAPPIGDWCRPQDGVFGMIESPKYCPQMECLPPTFQGNIPLVYFFPELALSTLRAFKAYQFSDGAVPFMFSGYTYRTPPCGFVNPDPGWQLATNGPQYVAIVNRYWLCTGDDAFLAEFYPSIKRVTEYTMSLRPDLGPEGIISVSDEVDGARKLGFAPGYGSDWMEACEFHGMTAHVAGIHLAHLTIAERMAQKVGDTEFAERCRAWFADGSNSLEAKLWTGDYYLNYLDPITGRRSDLVLAYQLDGEWIARSEGVGGVFAQDRVAITLDTIRRTNVALTDYGATNFANPDGTPAEGVGYGTYGVPTNYLPLLAMVYMYAGERDFGIELVRRHYDTISKQGHIWSVASGTRGDRDTGEVASEYGSHLNMILWGLPAAIAGTDLRGPTEPGGLVERILTAAKSDEQTR